MKIILNDYIENLGERGDSVVVKPGFARNYLLPKGLAYPDTPGNRRRFEQEQKHWEEMDLSRRSAADVLAKEIEGTEMIFERRAGERDVLFGSVTVADIVGDLADKGFEVDRKRVVLDHPIKEIGNYDIVLNIHRDVQVTLPVFVVRPGEEPNRGDDQEVIDASAGEHFVADAPPVQPVIDELAVTEPEPESEAVVE